MKTEERRKEEKKYRWMRTLAFFHIRYSTSKCTAREKNGSLPDTRVLCYEKQDAYRRAATEPLSDTQGYTEHFSD